MGKLFGTDGIRGIANSELTCELAVNIGRSVAITFSDNRDRKPKILIGKDTRISSDMIEGALKCGICSVGADVVVVGVVPTPAVAFLVRAYGADAGIMISASHNPYQFNGIKIFNGDGYKLDNYVEEKIENLTLEGLCLYKYPIGENVGSISYESEALYDYTNYIKSLTKNKFDGIRLAIDCANGAASETAEELFKGLGAECHMLFNAPDGININEDCGSTCMGKLAEYVVNNNMDLGVAFDGDADRCLVVDEKGEEVDGDAIMAICALDMLERGILSNNTVVGTIMTNMGFSEFCNKSGINFEVSGVGDRHVIENMIANNYNLGGEQSGHIIFHDFSTTGDGQLTAVQLIDALKRKDQTLLEARKIIKSYPQSIVNIDVNKDKKCLIHSDHEVIRAISEANESLGGIGRIIVRESGTEPLVRVMVECLDSNKMNEIANKVALKISERLS